MLKISPQQMEYFRILSRKDFESRVATHLRKHLTEECTGFDDASLHEWVSKAIARAEQLQIRKERNVVAYMDIMMWLENNEERHRKAPLVQEILNDSLIDFEDDRIEIVLGYVLDETPWQPYRTDANDRSFQSSSSLL